MKRFLVSTLFAVSLAAAASTLSAQGVTTGSLAGRVTNKQAGTAMAQVRVRAVHMPSGTAYQALTRNDGRYSIPAMRVGGPYTVTASTIGFAPQQENNVVVQIGRAHV